MNRAALFLLGLSLSSPALATQGMLCTPAAGIEPRLSLVIGAGGIAGASLEENGRQVSTMVPGATLFLAQAWIDREQVLADVVSASWNRVAQLRARFEPPARREPMSARGTLTLRGRTWQVRCVEN